MALGKKWMCGSADVAKLATGKMQKYAADI